VSLEVHGLHAGYGGTEVLRAVDLAVPRGSVVALLGPNGAGKTTLLRACGGFLAPSSGRVRLDGVDRTGTPAHRLAGLGVCYVPEGRAVFPSLTVAENLRLLPGGRRTPPDRALEAFPALGRKLRQAAGTMSGGEQQMLALARAYLTDPEYLLLDEVSMGLAPVVVDQIFASLATLVAEGVALLLVEQYVTKALALADEVRVLQKGRITFAAPAHDVDVERLAASYLDADDIDAVVADAAR
jgi:branched-chain amino acid transport system ATP-binding protein